MLVTCQRFGDLFLFGLVWQYSTNKNQYNKGRFKVMATQLQQYFNFELPSYTASALQRQLNFCNGNLSLLYFWIQVCNYAVCANRQDRQIDILEDIIIIWHRNILFMQLNVNKGFLTLDLFFLYITTYVEIWQKLILKLHF